jgi:hypothetical protein
MREIFDLFLTVSRGRTNTRDRSLTDFALSPSLMAWLTVAFLWITAVYFLVRMSGTTTLPSGHDALIT